MSENDMEYHKLNRVELRDRFRAGRMPTEDDFMSLIESMVNSVDEGFDVSEDNGLAIRQQKENGRLLSFFSSQTEYDPLWSANVLKNTEKGETSLNLKVPNMGVDESAMTFVGPLPSNVENNSSKVRVGIGCAAPKSELDVNGSIASKGRVGHENEKFEVFADGEWYDVTDVLTGCQCFEIVAGVGGVDGDGKFALTHAIAVNVFNSHPSVNVTQSYSGGRGSRIDIRWQKNKKNKFEFTLQLRVHGKFKNGNKIKVRYHLTQLWFDTQMNGSVIK